MQSHSRLLSGIARAVGDAVLSGPELQAHLVDGIRPELLITPQSEEQLGEVVRLCRDGEFIIFPAGAEHQVLEVRRPADPRPVIVVSMRGLNRCISYSREDLTMTVQSGMLLAAIDELVSPAGQHLPIDPPYAQSATIGGAAACNADGPRSLRYGGIGDLVLGGAMVLADGEIIKSGGQTVKNVAGYDLHKLFLGSFGSLGVITRLALKLRPIPEDFRIADLLLDSAAEAEYVAGHVVRGPTRPCLLTFFNSVAARDLGHSLAERQILLRIGYEDSSAAVDWQVDQLQAAYPNGVATWDSEGSLSQYRGIAEWPTQSCDFSFEAVTLGIQSEPLVEYCTDHHIAIMAHAGRGVALGRGQGALTPQAAASIRSLTGPGGSVKFMKLPAGSNVPRWSSTDPAQRWMRAVKEQFDPKRIFSWPSFLGR